MDDVGGSVDPVEFKVNELLNEVRVDYTPALTKVVDDTVSAIKEAISKIPDDFQVTADLALKFVRDIGADKVDFKFKKPQYVGIAGSYATHCVVKPEVIVDLFIRLPKECFHEKDYLNHRYFAKRCLYLCLIKKHLRISSLVSKVSWSVMHNEARKPVLVVYPVTQPVEFPNLYVRIVPTAKSLFNISKLKMTRNNIHSVHQGNTWGTPIYNSSILEDMFMEDTTEFVNKHVIGAKELRDGLTLLKVWARQRSFLCVHDCLNGFLISVILAYLASLGKISNSLKALQIFRIVIDFIATSKVWRNGLFFKIQEEKSFTKEERTQYQNLFPVVICNMSTQFNLAFRMSESAFSELQDEAALTLSCMEKCKDCGFEEVFMTKVDLPVKYDICMRLNLKGDSGLRALQYCLDEERWRLYELKVQALLQQGLGDRARVVRVTWRNTPFEFDLKNGLSALDGEPLFVGISISSLEKAFRAVDIGPDAENKEEAMKFRKFWGKKAELRRFKDGKIAESTVWENNPRMRHLIVKSIVEHVLAQHLSLSKDDVLQFLDQLDFSLVCGAEDRISFSTSLVQAFEVLSKRLRHIQDIPLKVSSVQPLDSAFRFMSVFPPEPHPLIIEKGLPRQRKRMSSCVQPLEVMLQLEGSGNWPVDDIAIEKTKTAFLYKIAESLQNNYGMAYSATEDDVDVLMSGFAFRLRILHERGLTLLKREVGSGPGKRVSFTDKELFVRGQHSSMINGLQGRYQMFSPVVRLAKRWIASHLFSNCLKEESLELLVASLFVKSFPFRAPCSRITGFLRFLRLLSEFDWSFSPLIVDINNDLSPVDMKEINEHFMLSRKMDRENGQVEPAMFLATSYDKASEAWTRSSPSVLERKRLVAYARSSANLLTRLILHDRNDTYGWECLFRTPLNNYDAVILLHRNKLPYPQQLLFPSEMNEGKTVARGSISSVFHPFLGPGELKGSSQDVRTKLMVDFDPVQCFLRDVEKDFPSKFKIWYDSIGGDAVGLTWERPASKKRGREEEGKVVDDPVELLKTVGELGKGFVRSVHLLKAPRTS
ncbi:hypothetical protein MLD38_007764 [Melastoma candidum]|uniref:Uncharacterized protein n=1 Tax=Melastoma candidum TaxID=119954 RepID=A0ACB9RSA1_9MYRT|nr:hypothetical protein MLD38_007764 [Melastoma candidum]